MAHHEHRAVGVADDRVAVGGSQPSNLVGVGAAHNSQIDGATLPLAGPHPGAAGNGLDVHIRIAPDPAVKSPIDLPHGGVAAPSFLHGLVHNLVVVRVVIEHDGDHTDLRRRSVGIGADDRYRTLRGRHQRDSCRAQQPVTLPSPPGRAHANHRRVLRLIDQHLRGIARENGRFDLDRFSRALYGALRLG